MVQIIETGNPQGKLSEMLGMSLGEGLGNGLNTFFANRSLESVLQDKALEKAPISKKLEAIRSALSPYGEKGQEIFNQRMQIEQQELQEGEKESLSKVIAGKDLDPEQLKRLSPQNQLKVLELQKKRESGRSVYDSLIKAGYPDETAKIWQNQMENAPVGGQSDVIRNVNDLIRRSKSGKGIDQGNESESLSSDFRVEGFENPLKLDLPELPQETGLTPADMIRREDARQKYNIPAYDDAVNKLNMFHDDLRDFKYMSELNDTPGALPTGIGKNLNVDWETGDLRFPALSTPETQAYVKTLARQLSRAKNDFPGRVTNFDLEQFKKKFPTLANSPEGRRLILQQLETATKIANLKEEITKAVYDKYGSSADPMFVRKISQDNYSRIRKEMEGQLEQINKKTEDLYNKSEKYDGTESNKSNRPSLDEIFE